VPLAALRDRGDHLREGAGLRALAGVAALTVASMGFIAKLFAEAIEEISMKQVEAVRATGAGPAAVLAYGVLPQVASRFVGFCIYQLDSNLRNSTLVGSSARAASAARCLRPSSASTTTSWPPSCCRSSR
jgi:ABC-type amino acid transport system permease subunit